MVELYDYQEKAIGHMKNGCILCGGVGSGKSRTALAYYYILNGGTIGAADEKELMVKPCDLYIITTARKRDTFEWESEFLPFRISSDPECTPYKNKVVVDSWNNIKKYVNVTNAFFIFDEQRVVGWGAWAKSFIKITRSGNRWIMLSATPGDTWMDYCAVFVANGFFKNRTDFIRTHVVYSAYVTKYPKIDRYVEVGRLMKLRDSILVNMDFNRITQSHHEDVWTEYSTVDYRRVMRDRWNIWEERPLSSASELCYALRKIVNSDDSRLAKVLELCEEHPRVIIFYNFDYELELLKGCNFGAGVEVAEWNGHKHQPVPDGNKWVYLVQYTAGAEGWNCTSTDTIIFFSQNYSYKIMIQSSGRIDRLNTKYTDLYYYHLKSHASIDLAISRALRQKKKFNESKWVSW